MLRAVFVLGLLGVLWWLLVRTSLLLLENAGLIERLVTR